MQRKYRDDIYVWGRDLVDFLKQVYLFKDFRQGDLKRLARIVHERAYRDSEYIYEQGNQGVALYIVRRSNRSALTCGRARRSRSDCAMEAGPGEPAQAVTRKWTYNAEQ
jgi:CRP-like cAMP-binding protein